LLLLFIVESIVDAFDLRADIAQRLDGARGDFGQIIQKPEVLRCVSHNYIPFGLSITA
jgi:hypothetical protein